MFMGISRHGFYKHSRVFDPRARQDQEVMKALQMEDKSVLIYNGGAAQLPLK